jgi:uncharacterized protein YoaH (UPF0181 family)
LVGISIGKKVEMIAQKKEEKEKKENRTKVSI